MIREDGLNDEWVCVSPFCSVWCEYGLVVVAIWVCVVDREWLKSRDVGRVMEENVVRRREESIELDVQHGQTVE